MDCIVAALSAAALPLLQVLNVGAEATHCSKAALRRDGAHLDQVAAGRWLQQSAAAHGRHSENNVLTRTILFVVVQRHLQAPGQPSTTPFR